MYQRRTYRTWSASQDLVSFCVSVQETNLFVSARSDLKRKTEKLVYKYRHLLQSYISGHPEFLTSLKPIDVSPQAPSIVKTMAHAAKAASVGPMAAVAGAVAEFIGRELAEYSPDIIIENGGDIFIKSTKARTIGIFAGESPLTGRIGMEIEADETPCGVCTSSGTVGHSLSFGKADAAVIISPSTSLADAVATASANLVQNPDDIPRALELAGSIPGVSGAVIVIGDRIGVRGSIRLTEV